MTGTVPALLRAAESGDLPTATAAIKAAGDMAGAKQAADLTDILLKRPLLPAAEAALLAACTREPVSPACVDPLLAALPRAEQPARTALLRVLGAIGGERALAAVRAATGDSDQQVRDVALRLICQWPTPDALPDLKSMANSPASPAVKILALRGQFRLIPMQSAPADQKIKAMKDAIASIERSEEKRLALAALGEIPCAESLAMVMPEITNAAVRAEACLAAVAIAKELAEKEPELVADAMRRVVAAADNEQLARRARALIRETRKPDRPPATSR